MVRRVGALALGVLVDDGEHAAIVEDESGITIADARIDAVLPGGPVLPSASVDGLAPLVVAFGGDTSPTLSRIAGWRLKRGRYRFPVEQKLFDIYVRATGQTQPGAKDYQPAVDA